MSRRKNFSNMTDQEIIELVVKMREAQRKYFTDRTAYNLQLAKHLELRVDQAIKGSRP